MALRKGTNPDIDEPFCIFWNEYHDIEQTSSLPRNTEEEVGKKEDYDKNENEIQWLSDVGFTKIAEKLRDHKRIDHNDEDMRMITSSLTRSQANAVRRRIDFLNDVIQENQAEVKSPTAVTQLRKHKDVREIFDTQKNTELSGRPVRSRCMTDDSSKKHHHGQRQHVSKSVSDGMFKDVPTTVHQHPKVSSKISSSPVVAVKPNYSRNVKSPVEKKKNEYHDDKSKRSENRKHSGARSENSKGFSHQSNELGKHIPGSQLTFISGEQRDRVINEKSKSNRPKTPKNNNLKNQNSGSQSKLPDRDEYHRRHSVPTNKIIDNKNSSKSTSDNEYSKLEKVEVDGGIPSSEISDLDNTEIISAAYSIDELFGRKKSKNNVSTGLSNGGMKNIKGINSPQKVPTQDYKVSLVVTSQQSVCLPYSSHPKNTSTSYTITSVQNNVSHMSPSRTSSSPYMIPSTGSIPCASEKSTPRNIISQKDRVKKSSSCSPSPVSFSPSSPPDLDIIPGFITDNKLKKNLTSTSSLEYETDIVPFDSLSKSLSPKESRHYPTSPKERRLYPTSPKESRLYPTSPKESRLYPTSPKETRLYSDVDNKKYKELSQSKLNTNHLRTSDTHNDLHSGSEDSKSISSRESCGSLDEGCIDPSQISISMGKDSPEPRRDQSPAPDGDARLDVGPMIIKEQPDVIQSYPNLPKFPPLPNFNLSKDITGMTEVDDLSDTDMEKVRSIALIELTALFDAYHINMNRKKPLLRPKFKDSGVFGVALTSLSQREVNKKHEKATVPRVFKEILIFIERHGLKEEGVLRVPGSTHRIKALREAIDKNDLNSIKWEERNVKDVSACLKQFLRDLPEPLLSYEYQNTFLSVEDLPDRKIQLQALNLLVILLKPIHQKTLKALLDTLKKIIDNEDSNKMGLNNVAMIMAPNLLLTNGNKIEIEGQQKAAAMTDIMRMLIKYQSILWTIPSFMVGQIRCIYDSGVKTKDPKAVKKIIQRQGLLIAQRGKPPRSSGSSGDELDHVEAIIRVKAPSLNKQSMAIKLTTETTASDVIAKFQWRRQNSQKEKDDIESTRLNIQDRSSLKGERKGIKYHLYEAGGNIGERRLEGSANVTAIIKVNPCAEWVLKGYEK